MKQGSILQLTGKFIIICFIKLGKVFSNEEIYMIFTDDYFLKNNRGRSSKIPILKQTKHFNVPSTLYWAFLV